MKIFSLDKNYEVIWEPQVLLLAPFEKLFKRDKTKGKMRANKELAYVWFMSDIRSEYHIHDDLTIKTAEIKNDLKLPAKWKPDVIVQEAVKFYKERSTSVSAKILTDSKYVANKISTKMKEAIDQDDLDISELEKLLNSLKKIPDVIRSIKAAEAEVIKEIEVAQDSLGSKEKALFEDLQLHSKQFQDE